ncbi:GGDEF domain-containing protein [Aliidiomarina haloalkalitolerans]|uniref:diguanylate cyclase n=1 Tax=Aliidiomarina haloalkalitolerans TaxID=859059 RepID=A0A432VVV2_9GAMM|nr:GGDEF domain-containing protein [Aliidiomarina haloalkalitolerans]MCL4409103.1 GGDEF domain-containing protein [Gammaproteobacteria bacterium]RUO20730.1 hypothetical protein CWE06_05350 [Aliidiomarina haloalkalitolerans]
MDDLATLPMWVWVAIAVPLVIALVLWLQKRNLHRQFQHLTMLFNTKQQELAEKQRVLEQLQILDQVTGVFNRKHLEDRLEEAFSHGRRYKRPMSIIMFEIDLLQRIANEFGQQTCNHVLYEFAALVSRTTRRSDIFGRWDSSRFLLICPETSASQAEILANKIRELVLETRLDSRMRVTISGGIQDLTNIETVDRLLVGADIALQEAKTQGRNRICLL